MAHRIVVGIDGSPAADAALARALDEARVRHAEVEAVTCWHPTYCNGFALTPATDPRSAALLLDAALGRVAPDGPAVHRTVVRGGAASTLAELAEDADLVVVGEGDRRLRSRILWGSLPRDLAQRTTTPVVVVSAPRARAVEPAIPPVSTERWAFTRV